MKGGYSDIWKAIIRPPRDEYQLSELGPKEFKVNGKKIQRTDLELKNKRGLKLQCSFFEPVKRVAEQLPCVIYLHGNSSSRLEAMPCIRELLPSNIQLFCFDFSGCGQSDGEYISLGWYERDDVDCVVDYLRNCGKVLTIGMWGRSMGAVTALMHADRDPSIGGMVIDSAFTNLRKLAEELCKQYTKIPGFILGGAISIVNSTIKSKANFDINNLTPINHVKQSFIPAMFIAGKSDTFIKPEHTKQLYDAYQGDKNMMLVDGDHNSYRPQYLLDSVGIFFYNTLQCASLPADQIDHENDEDEEEKGNLFTHHLNIGNQHELADQFGQFDEDEMALALKLSLDEKKNEQQDEKKQEEKDEEKEGERPKIQENEKKQEEEEKGK